MKRHNLFICQFGLAMTLLFINQISVFSQSYQLTFLSGTFTPLTDGINVPEIQNDDVLSDTIDIGFSFNFWDKSYTQLLASSNGFLCFNLEYSDSYSFPDNYLDYYNYGLNFIAPLWDNLSGETGTAKYKLEGTAPNRVFTFEWLNWQWDYDAISPVISFQVKLYETSNRIEFVYRKELGDISIADNESGASIGLLIGETRFYSLNNSGTAPTLSSTQGSENILTKPANGQTYQFNFVIKPEPTNHATVFTASNTGKAVSLNWVDAIGETLPDGYVILASTTNSFTNPVDLTEVSSDLDLSDGKGCAIVSQGAQSFSGFLMTEFNTNCYFAIYPFTNSGIYINYKTDGIVPHTSAFSAPKPEPSNHATAFIAATNANTISLSWTDATGSNIPDGYLIMISKTSSFTNPVDGIEPDDDTNLDDDFGMVKILKGVQTFSDFTNKESNTNYYARIYSYTNSGVFINYKSTGDIPYSIYSPISFSEQIENTIAGNQNGSVDYGDYDNDGYIDILFTGDVGNTNLRTIIYHNNGDNTFDEELGLMLPQLWYSKGIWGDYNNDGFLDIMMMGGDGSQSISTVYRNNRDRSFSEETNASFDQLVDGDAAWGDYNNDGKTDILYSGSSNFMEETHLMRNNGDSTFTSVSGIPFPTNISSIDWGDYNNDGFLDVLTTGSFGTYQSYASKLFKNNGNSTFTEQPNLFQTNFDGNGKWGDYNNDGYLDILFFGPSSKQYDPTVIIYKNNGDGTFSEQTDIHIEGYWGVSADWGDFNNDGFLDIVKSGVNSYYTPQSNSKIYLNNQNGDFIEESGTMLPSYGQAIVKWVDIDQDNDLDIIINGNNSTSGRGCDILVNDAIIKNTKPEAPENLLAIVNGTTVTLTWDRATDTETSQLGLSYNIYMGTTPTQQDIFSSNADITTGQLQFAKRGNFQINSYTVKNLKGGNYYWGVQAVDAGFMGSEFSAQSNFSIIHYNSIAPTKNDTLLLGESGTPLTVTESLVPDYRVWKYSFNAGGPYENIIAGETSETYIPNFSENGIYYVVCVSYFGAVEVVSNEVSFDVQQFTELSQPVPFENLAEGDIAWGDYDNDNDLDILITGSTFYNSSYYRIAKIYKNNGDETFTEQTGILLTGVSNSSVSWGDYDSDGYLDILLTGTTDGTNAGGVSKIYHNNAGTGFSEQSISLIGVNNGSAAWVDYDNDGDLDIFIAGYAADGNSVFKMYNNDNASFNEMSHTIVPFANGKFDLGDYNNDGYIDIIMCGYDYSGNRMTRIYSNSSNGNYTELPVQNIPKMNYSSVEWGDYDNDGYLDILIAGAPSGGNTSTKIYHNNGDSTFTEQTSISLMGVIYNSLAWGDYDNDGYLDIIITGLWKEYTTNGFTKIYRNNREGSFSEQTNIKLPGICKSSVKWGDLDNDGDLDILMFGKTEDVYSGSATTKIFKNHSVKPKSPPVKPENLNTNIIDNGHVVFKWNKASDNQTPKDGLTYNIAVASVLGLDTTIIKYPLSNMKSGFRKVVKIGNVGKDTTYIIKGLSVGNYIWTVQAIDNSYAGSQFSDWKSFEILPQFTEEQTLFGFNDNHTDWIDYNNDGRLDIFMTGDIDYTDGYYLLSVGDSKLYKNQNDLTFVEQTDINFPGVYFTTNIGSSLEDDASINKNGGVAWGDYNNDGFLDIFMVGDTIDTGTYPRPKIAKVYSNNGDGTFSEQTRISIYALTGSCSAAWVDYDNDGDQDIYVAGAIDLSYSQARLYRNNGDSTFTQDDNAICWDMGTRSSSAWGDYDNDGYLDLLLTGEASFYDTGSSRIYRNNGNGTFSLQNNISITGVKNSSASWADYNNDGFLDFLISGWDDAYNRITKIYKNNGNGTFTDINTFIRGVVGGNVTWGDYDNDGDSDILMCGVSSKVINSIYRNDGNNIFLEQLFGFHEVTKGYSGFGDYDNDGDLDIVSSGYGVTKIYQNHCYNVNTAPTEPQSLHVERIGANYQFLWSAATDDKTPANSLTYNLRIGKTPGGHEIMSPLGKTDTSILFIPTMGNCQLSKSKIIKQLKPGTYYWSVQAIDQAYQPGNWADEQILVVSPIVADLSATTVCIGSETQFTDNSITSGESIISWLWQFGDDSVSNNRHPKHIYKNAGNYLVTLTIQSATYQNSVTKEITVKSGPIANFIASPVCIGNPTIFENTSVVPEGISHTWKWNFGDGTSNSEPTTQNPDNYTYLQPDTLMTKLKVVGENGCTDSITKQVIVTPKPDANIFVSSDSKFSFCKNSGDSAYIFTGNQLNCSYQWLYNNVDIAGKTTESITIKENGGSFKIRVTNLVGSCSDTTTNPVVITVNTSPEAPVINQPDQTTICQGDTVKLFITPVDGLSYLWNGGLNTNTLNTYAATTTGTYTLKVKNSASCEAASVNSVLVTVNPKPEVPALSYGATTFCKGQSVNFTTDSVTGIGYKWKNTLGTLNNTYHYAAIESGSYWLELTKGECTTKTTPVAVVVKENPDIPSILYNANETTFCDGESILLRSSAMNDVYAWFSKNATLPVNNDSVHISESGTYRLLVSKNYENGLVCSTLSGDSVTITKNAKPLTPTITAIGDTIFCMGDSVKLNVTAQNGATYSWLKNETDFGTNTNQIKVTEEGTYKISVTNTHGCATASSNAINITVNPSPQTPEITASGTTTVCEGEPLLFSISQNPNENYQWYRGFSALATQTNDTLIINQSGDYYVQASIGNCQAASNKLSATVTPLPAKIEMELNGQASFCEGNFVTITANGNSTSEYAFQWLDANNTAIEGATGNKLTVNTTGSYKVKVSDLVTACTLVSDTVIDIEVHPKPDVPEVKIKDNLTAFCQGLQTTLYTPAKDVAYQWLKVNDSQFSVANDSLMVSEHGTYYLKVSNSSNCEASSTTTAITVYNTPTLYNPTAAGSTNFCEGGNVELKTNYTTADLSNCTLKWLKNGNSIDGANDKNYTATESGTYSLEVTSNESECSVTTSNVEVRVDEMPATPIVIEENNITSFCPATELKLIVDNASTNYNYQWQRSGANIEGATNSFFQGKLKSGDYSVIVTSGSCSGESNVWSLTTRPAPEKPEIFAQGPYSWIVACNNDTATGYQWYYNNEPIAGANSYAYLANENLGNYYVEINDGGECWTKSDVINIPSGEIINGIAGLSEKTVNIYPNPSKGVFTLAMQNATFETTRVIISNIVGKTISTYEFSGITEYTFDLSHLKAGTYFCRISHKDQTVVKKVIKE